MKIEIYRGSLTRQWYWRLRATNGRIMADGGEAYMRRPTMEKSVRRLFPDAANFPIVEVEA